MAGRPWRGAASWVVGAAALVVSLPWAFGYLLPQSGTLSLAAASLAGYSPYGLLLVTVAGLALRTWWVAVAATVVLAAQVVTLAPGYAGATASSGSTLTVMTVNVRFGYGDAHRVLAAVRSEHVDVLAVVELNNRAEAGLRHAGVDTELPYAQLHTAYGATGVGLWSRTPLREAPRRALTYESTAADIDVAGTRLRLRVVHPPPPLGATPGAWQSDYASLRQQVAMDGDVATVLLGDFNASVHHRALRRLMDHRWRDAAEVRGVGLVRTFAPRLSLPAVLDPDHVLVDRGMGVRRWRTVSVPGSDHRAVLAQVVLPRK